MTGTRRRPGRYTDRIPTSENDAIRDALRNHAGLDVEASSLAPDADLYAAGMSSHASVNVMLAIEEALDVEFPDELMKRGTFQSIAAVEAALAQIRAAT